MKNSKVFEILNDLINRYPNLEVCKKDILDFYYILEKCFDKNGILLIAGNGGSAADSEHIAGELMKGFNLKRPLNKELKKELLKVNNELGEVLGKELQKAFSCIPLVGQNALSSAYMNDCNPYLVYAQQINGLGKENDVFLGISTSGNSKNILYGAVIAKAKKMKVLGLTGENESELSKISDVCIKAPEWETYKIQELHLPIYHCICLMLEERFFGNE